MEGSMKTKGIKNLERKMEDVGSDGFRYRVLESAKDFKSSWLGLGQVLFSVWKEKMYKEWGYQEFETYVSKEIGIKKQTALKLLRSYSFLEKEEPGYLESGSAGPEGAAAIPNYEAVDVLRRASQSKDLDREDYARVRKYVLEDGKDVGEVRKDLASIRKERLELDPDEEAARRERGLLSRLLSALRSVKTELGNSSGLSRDLIKGIAALTQTLEDEIGDN